MAENSATTPAGKRGLVSSLLASENLRWRIVSGLILIPIALGGLWLGVLPFAVLIAALAIVMSWEWSRLVRDVDHDIAFIVQGAAVAFAALATVYGAPAIAGIALVIAAVTIAFIVDRRALISAVGVFYAGLPAIALVWFRADEPHGFWAVLYILTIVWVSDIAAYVFGRLIGGPKLWPDISPNKTWAGLIGALVASGVAGALFSALVAGGPTISLAFTSIVLGAVAQAGDLLESALKREFNVKDVSGLIPGHGGVMDRLDSIVAVATCAGILALTLNPNAPAKALFFGG